jgi:arylformamidase
MQKDVCPDVVGRLGPYRTVSLSKVIDPGAEKRRCVIRRHKAEVQGVVDYHSDVDIMSHLGTHVEAPFHHGDELPDVVQLAPDRFVGRGVLLRLDSCKPRALITRADLDAADNGRVRAEDVVILDSLYHHEPFIQSPDDERPQLSRESAEWFAEKGVKAVGLGDGVAIENSAEHCIACHDILMGRGVTFIEVLQHLDKLERDTFIVVFLPLPIRGLDSSPVHVLAIEGVPGF